MANSIIKMESQCIFCENIGTHKCDECHDILCHDCVYTYDGDNYCLGCLGRCKEKCPSCKKKLIGDYNAIKKCLECKKEYCIQCIAWTACQWKYGYCKNCYDYKCKLCDNDIHKPYESIYFDDIAPLPLCTKHLNMRKTRNM